VCSGCFPRLGSRLRHGAQLAWQEVIRGPGAADRDFAVLQLLGSTRIAVLIFLDGFAINQVGDVDEHAIGFNALAADFLFQRIETTGGPERRALWLWSGARGRSWPFPGALKGTRRQRLSGI